jgi:hypothetical protein
MDLKKDRCNHNYIQYISPKISPWQLTNLKIYTTKSKKYTHVDNITQMQPSISIV